MSYRKVFKGPELEPLMEQAKAFLATLDRYSQPSIEGTWRDPSGAYHITVHWYGLD